jgi:hypothetical protein
MKQKCKTEIKLLRPEDVWHPPIGAPRGNRYAAKRLSTIKARIRAFHRRWRALARTLP